MTEKIEIDAAVIKQVLAAMEQVATELDSPHASEAEEERVLHAADRVLRAAITALRHELLAPRGSRELSDATYRLLYGLLANNDDHLTACDRTMGATHPCTCGADKVRKLLNYGVGKLNLSELVVASDEALNTLCRIAVLVPPDDDQVERAITALKKALWRE